MTIDDVRIIGAVNLTDVYTWVDEDYVVHPKMRSHTGEAMTLGIGVLHSKSSKQIEQKKFN